MAKRRRMVAFLVFAGLTGLVAMRNGLAQGSCARTYHGDLVLQGHERLVITEGVLCVYGSIMLHGDAVLEISGATLRMAGPSERLWEHQANIYPRDRARIVMRDVRVETPGSNTTGVWIWMAGSARTELERVTTVGVAWLGVHAPDTTSVVVKDSTIQTVFVADRGSGAVVNSQLKGVTLRFSGASSVELSNLRPALYDSWAIPQGTGARPSLSLERTRVGGWRIEAADQARVSVRDSQLDHFALYLGDLQDVVSGLRPGHYSTWSLQAETPAGTLGDVRLVATSVGGWTVYVRDRRRDLSIRESSLVEFSTERSTFQVRFERTTVLGIGLWNSRLTLECGSLTVLHGISLVASRLDIDGALRFQYTAHQVVLENSTMNRTYEVQVQGTAGRSAADIGIGLEDPWGRVSTHTTDQSGLLRFSIWFDSANYDKTWNLLVPRGDAIVRVPIKLLTSTPVQIAIW